MQRDVIHVADTFGRGTKDEEFLPEVGKRGLILVTVDHNMRGSSGKGGHGALLKAHNVKVLFLPKAYLSAPIGIPASDYPSVGWMQCAWLLRYWHEIEEQTAKMKNLSLARITDKGKVEPIA